MKAEKIFCYVLISIFVGFESSVLVIVLAIFL